MTMYDDSSGPTPRFWVTFGLIVVFVIMALVTLFSSMTSVDTGKVGVVTNFGRVTGRELDEGLSWINPWTESTTIYDVKTQQDSQQAQASTNDLQPITANVVLNHRLQRGDVSNMHQRVGVNYYQTVVNPIVQDAFKTSSAKYNVLTIINNRETLRSDILTNIRERLAKRAKEDKITGIVIEDLSITNISLSKQYQNAIEQRQVAQQNAERAKYNLEQARLDAQSQEVQAKTLTDNYLELKQIELQMQALKHWNGVLPQTVTGGADTFFNIPLRGN